MIRILTILFLVPAISGVVAQDKPFDSAQGKPRINKEMVERFKKLKPEEKQKLRERMKMLQSLSPEERARLRENFEKFRTLPPEQQRKLRDHFDKMQPDDRKRAMDLSAGFMKWSSNRLGPVQFPRLQFFKWAMKNRPEKMEEMKDMEEGARKDEFLRLAHEFRLVQIQDLEKHARKHKCVSVEEIQDLRDSSMQDFWANSEKLMSKCPGRPPKPTVRPDRMPPPGKIRKP